MLLSVAIVGKRYQEEVHSLKGFYASVQNISCLLSLHVPSSIYPVFSSGLVLS